MNGARIEFCAKIRKSANRTIKISMGKSHHLLRRRMKCHSSLKIESLDMWCPWYHDFLSFPPYKVRTSVDGFGLWDNLIKQRKNIVDNAIYISTEESVVLSVEIKKSCVEK